MGCSRVGTGRRETHGSLTRTLLPEEPLPRQSATTTAICSWLTQRGITGPLWMNSEIRLDVSGVSAGAGHSPEVTVSGSCGNHRRTLAIVTR